METSRNRLIVVAKVLRASAQRIQFDPLTDEELEAEARIIEGVAEELETTAAAPDPAGEA